MRKLLYSKRKLLFALTDALCELVGGGVPLPNALSILSARDTLVGSCARRLHKSLSDGMSLSLAFCSTTDIAAPEWFSAYISVAEECERIAPILLHLRNLLEHERRVREKMLALLAYPCFVILLTAAAGFFSVYFLLPSLSVLFGSDFSELQSQAVKTMVFADAALLLAFVLLVFFAKKLLSSPPCLHVIQTMAFLSEHDIPTIHAVSCAFAFTGREKKTAFALLSVRNRLLGGEKIAECFGSCFEEAGFRREGRILSEFLYLCEQTGKQNGFARSASVLEERQIRAEKIMLSSMQPLLLLLATFYVALILKTAFLPYITSLGGIL